MISSINKPIKSNTMQQQQQQQQHSSIQDQHQQQLKMRVEYPSLNSQNVQTNTIIKPPISQTSHISKLLRHERNYSYIEAMKEDVDLGEYLYIFNLIIRKYNIHV